MLKDKLAQAVIKALDNERSGNDYIPFGMRGELEVIAKDRDGNIISYERGHNQVTNLAKMQIIHLLAGELGVIDSPLYSITSGNSSLRKFTKDSSLTGKEKIYSTFIESDEIHSTTKNLDGTMVSGEQYFFSSTDLTSSINQVLPKDVSSSPLFPNYPTKMLFGTGLEAHDETSMEKEYSDESTSPTASAIKILNGYSTDSTVEFTEMNDNSNWYSASAYKTRTLQPSNMMPIQLEAKSTDTAIKGAIKNCLITKTGDAGKYDGDTKMALSSYRGVGYPCFIYAKRSTSEFPNASEGNTSVHYQMNSALGTSPYETELTYTVVMPAQSSNSKDIVTFYPYNGWVIKQAGLFSDARFKLRSVADDDATYGEDTYLYKIGLSESDSNAASIYRDSAGGMLLFTRNLSSPVMKTPDTELTFVWHVFIAI